MTIRKRQAEGIAAAKARGKYLGRPRLVTPKGFEEMYSQWKAKEVTVVKAASLLSISWSSFYKLARQQEATKEMS